MPVIEIVHVVETRKEAVELELKYIAQFGRKCDGSGILVNITIGGDGGSLGMKHSAEHIEKRVGKFRGKPRSEEAKAKYKAVQNSPEMKARHVIIKSNPEWLERQRVTHLGLKQSDEAKMKKSKALKGRKRSEETKRKISMGNTGKVRSAEARAKISAVQLGRKATPQAIANKIAAQKKLVLNTATGIYYHGLQEAAESLPMNLNTLRAKMSGHYPNNTPFVYA